jgi:hypothetical protein
MWSRLWVLTLVSLVRQQWVAVPTDKLDELHDLANAYDVIGKLILFCVLRTRD